MSFSQRSLAKCIEVDSPFLIQLICKNMSLWSFFKFTLKSAYIWGQKWNINLEIHNSQSAFSPHKQISNDLNIWNTSRKNLHPPCSILHSAPSILLWISPYLVNISVKMPLPILVLQATKNKKNSRQGSFDFCTCKKNIYIGNLVLHELLWFLYDCKVFLSL